MDGHAHRLHLSLSLSLIAYAALCGHLRGFKTHMQMMSTSQMMASPLLFMRLHARHEYVIVCVALYAYVRKIVCTCP